MKLTNNEKSPWTDIFRITLADLQAMGSGGSRVIGKIPSNASVLMATIMITKFNAGVNAAATYRLGNGGGQVQSLANSLLECSFANLTAGPSHNSGILGQQAAGTTTQIGGIRPLITAGGSPLGADVNLVFSFTDSNLTFLVGEYELLIGLQIADLKLLN